MNGDMMALRRRAVAQYSARIKQGARMKREWDWMAAAMSLESEQGEGGVLQEEGGGPLPSELFVPHETVTGKCSPCMSCSCPHTLHLTPHSIKRARHTFSR